MRGLWVSLNLRAREWPAELELPSGEPSRLRKNPSNLSFRGAQGDEESRISFSFKARFLAKFTLRSFAALRACPEQREGTVRSGGANGLGVTRSRTFLRSLLA